MSCLKFYLHHILLVAFFSWLESPSGPRLHHFQCIVIIARLGLHGATLHATHQQVHVQLLNSLAIKSKRVKPKSVKLYLLLSR